MHAPAPSLTASTFLDAAEHAKLLVLQRLTAIIADPLTPVREARLTGAVLLRFIAAIESFRKRAAPARDEHDTAPASHAPLRTPRPAPTPPPPKAALNTDRRLLERIAASPFALAQTQPDKPPPHRAAAAPAPPSASASP